MHSHRAGYTDQTRKVLQLLRAEGCTLHYLKRCLGRTKYEGRMALSVEIHLEARVHPVRQHRQASTMYCTRGSYSVAPHPRLGDSNVPYSLSQASSGARGRAVQMSPVRKLLLYCTRCTAGIRTSSWIGSRCHKHGILRHLSLRTLDENAKTSTITFPLTPACR